jgi:hypothetical protein
VRHRAHRRYGRGRRSHVRTKLSNDAAIRLESTSKNYGLLVFERLRQTDEALQEIAALALADRLQLADIRGFTPAISKSSTS